MTDRWKRRSSATVVLGIVALLSTAVADRAEACLPCNAYLDGFGQVVHRFVSEGTRHDCDPSPTCHPWEMYAFCGNFHYVCNVEDDEDVDALALIDSVDRAVQGDDVEGLTALLQRYNTIAQLVPERRAVQVIACGGILAAHFTLSHDLAEAIEVDN